MLYRFLCSLLVAVGMLCQPWAAEASGIEEAARRYALEKAGIDPDALIIGLSRMGQGTS